MKKSVFIIAYVDESGVEPRHKLLHFCQIYIADGIGNVARLFL